MDVDYGVGFKVERLDHRKPDARNVCIEGEFISCSCEAGVYMANSVLCKHVIAIFQLHEEGYL